MIYYNIMPYYDITRAYPGFLAGTVECAFFSKILRHNPLLVELDKLNRMVPEFSKLDKGKLLLAGVLCLVT